VKTISKNHFFIIFLAGLCSLYGQSVKKTNRQFNGYIILQFNTVVGLKQFNFDSTYTNSLGENFSISKFKYYISNIELENPVTGMKKSVPNSYYLINESDSASKKIWIDNDGIGFTKISFLIGVDSLKNVSGAQGGALDPANDMFWTWNTGYVMAKLEGSAAVSKQMHHVLEYHIGGFRGENNVLQRVVLDIPSQVGNILAGKKNLKLLIDVDLDKWFLGTHNLSISENPVCTTPGQLARQFSENYRQMFKLRSTSVEN